ncbi:MAG TPA: hydrogenase/urease maturation nickel metallochaperone HypA [Candidatus Angelobacter sp.]|nr:hydrogenase/urease maturation nickel metallochaperone HypA [Candidatus Angelobacter sp.]
MDLFGKPTRTRVPLEEIGLRFGAAGGWLNSGSRSLLYHYLGLMVTVNELAETRLVIAETAVEFHCATCNCVRNPVSVQRMACCVCGAPAGEIIAGRELEIVAIEVMENESATIG